VVADARQLVQVLWALPGESAFRRSCADVCMRFLGGDTSLVDEVFLNRRAQETLAREQPDHPARIFGEAVESDALKRKREKLELKTVEADIARAEADRNQAVADNERALADTKRCRISSFLEAFAMTGITPDDRALMQLRDMVGNVSCQTEVKELCVQAFVRSKGMDPRPVLSAFGRKLAALKRAELKEQGLPETLPTKRIEVNGQVVDAYLYTEADRPLFERAWELYLNPLPAQARPTQTLTAMWRGSSA